MIRLPSRRAALSWLAASVLLAGAACLDDGGVGPDGPTARLALRAQFGAVAVTGIRLEGSYQRSDQSSVPFAPQALSLPADRAPGTQATLPVTLDLARCLADPLAVPGGGACTVTLVLVLLDGARELDRVVIGPLVLRPGETASLAPVQLREAARVEVAAGTTAPLLPGETVQLSARLLDVSGGELPGRTFTWASATPAVATVNPTSGLVTAVAPGTSVVTAAAGGRSGQLTVTVRERAQIALSRSVVAFEGFTGAPRPDAAQVDVTNAVEGPLAGLARGAIDYSSGATDWLSAVLSSSTAPATLTLRPTRTDLADGTYTAVVPITAATAANSPQTVTVTYTVRDISNYWLYVESNGESEGFVGSGDLVGLRAVLLDPSETEVHGVPVSWAISPAGAGVLTPSRVTGEGAIYRAGSYDGEVEITASAGPLSATLELYQFNPDSVVFVPLRAPAAPRRATTTPARTRAPGGTP